MFDPNLKITKIAGWNLTHPKEVTTILQCCDKINTLSTQEPGWEGLFDPQTVTETITSHAQHTLNTGEAARSALHTARFKLAQELTRRVGEHLDSYLEQWDQRWAPAVAEYKSAMELLPDVFTAEEVVNFDPATFEAYRTACKAAATIHEAKQWLLSVASVIDGQSFNTARQSGDFLILTPVDVRSYAAIQLYDSQSADQAYSKIAPEIAHALRAGALLELSTPADAKATAEHFESERQELREVDWLAIRSSVIT